MPQTWSGVQLLTPHGFVTLLIHPLGWGWVGLGYPREAASEPPSLWSAWDWACLASLELLDRVRIHSARSQAQVDHRGGLEPFGEGEQEATPHHSGEG